MKKFVIFITVMVLTLFSVTVISLAETNDFNLSYNTNSSLIHPSETAIYDIIIRSTTPESQTVHFNVENVDQMPSGWSATFSDTDIVLAGGANATVYLYVTASSDADEEESVQVEISATSTKGFFDSATFTTTTTYVKECVWTVSIDNPGSSIDDPRITSPGDLIELPVKVFGGATAEFSTGFNVVKAGVVDASNNPIQDLTSTWNNYWTVSTDPPALFSSPTGNQFYVKILASDSLTIGHYIKIKAYANDGTQDYETSFAKIVKVSALSGQLGVDIIPTSPTKVDVETGKAPAVHTFSVKNTGSVTEAIQLNVVVSEFQGIVSNWDVRFYDLEVSGTVPVTTGDGYLDNIYSIPIQLPVNGTRNFKLEVYAKEGLGGRASTFSLNTVVTAQVTANAKDSVTFTTIAKEVTGGSIWDIFPPLPEWLDWVPGGWGGIIGIGIAITVIFAVLGRRSTRKREEKFEERLLLISASKKD